MRNMQSINRGHTLTRLACRTLNMLGSRSRRGCSRPRSHDAIDGGNIRDAMILQSSLVHPYFTFHYSSMYLHVWGTKGPMHNRLRRFLH